MVRSLHTRGLGSKARAQRFDSKSRVLGDSRIKAALCRRGQKPSAKQVPDLKPVYANLKGQNSPRIYPIRQVGTSDSVELRSRSLADFGPGREGHPGAGLRKVTSVEIKLHFSLSGFHKRTDQASGLVFESPNQIFVVVVRSTTAPSDHIRIITTSRQQR